VCVSVCLSWSVLTIQFATDYLNDLSYLAKLFNLAK